MNGEKHYFSYYENRTMWHNNKLTGKLRPKSSLFFSFTTILHSFLSFQNKTKCIQLSSKREIKSKLVHCCREAEELVCLSFSDAEIRFSSFPSIIYLVDLQVLLLAAWC